MVNIKEINYYIRVFSLFLIIYLNVFNKNININSHCYTYLIPSVISPTLLPKMSPS